MYQCLKCGRVFRHKTAILRHIQENHKVNQHVFNLFPELYYMRYWR